MCVWSGREVVFFVIVGIVVKNSFRLFSIFMEGVGFRLEISKYYYILFMEIRV